MKKHMIALFPTEKWWFELPLRGVFKTQPSIYDEVFMRNFSVLYYGATKQIFRPQPPNFFPIKISFIYFSLKKTALKKCLIFSPQDFQETELSYIFLKKAILIFRESYIQTLVYLEPGAHLEPWDI